MRAVVRARTDKEPYLVDSDRRRGAFIVPLYLTGVVFSERPAMDFLGLNLTPLRILLIAAVIPAVVLVCRRRDLRWSSFDWALILLVFWIFLALSVNNGMERGLKYGGALALEALGGYLIARAYIWSADQFQRMLKGYVVLIIIVGLFAIPEALSGIRVFSFLGTGAYNSLALVNDNPTYHRLGLFRAGVTFDHPILYGVFCATALGMVWYAFLDNRNRWLLLGGIFAATFLAVSSAPLLACIFTAAFIAWEKASRPIVQRTAITLWCTAAAAGIMQLFASRSLVAVLLPVVSLDHWTAYYRLLIWEYASNNIAENPYFGIGLNDWARPRWMPPSVDSYWLVIAMMGGLPAITFLVAFVLILLARVHQRIDRAESVERWRMRFAWTAAVLALCLQAFTVHYWGAMHSFFFFVLGSGAWMANAKEGLSLRRVAPVPRGIVHRPRFVHSSLLKPRRPPAIAKSGPESIQ
jgi:hypothetical protein